jgi:hypothetical protein
VSTDLLMLIVRSIVDWLCCAAQPLVPCCLHRRHHGCQHEAGLVQSVETSDYRKYADPARQHETFWKAGARPFSNLSQNRAGGVPGSLWSTLGTDPEGR